MLKSKADRKKPSRKRYEQEHPTVSFRLDKATYRSLKEHLKGTGCSFADFVKDALGREGSMVNERVAKLASKKLKERETPAHDVELYDIVLDLARWAIVYWADLPDPVDGIDCPSCLFPSRLSKKESGTVTMEMIEDGDFKCPECGLRIKNPPQLAWALLVSKVAEEVRREKFFRPDEKGASGGNSTLTDAESSVISYPKSGARCSETARRVC